MIVTCPKCKTSYEVDDSLITVVGKKVHCFNCGEIWVEYKSFEKVQKEEDAIENIIESIEDTAESAEKTSDINENIEISSEIDKVVEDKPVDSFIENLLDDVAVDEKTSKEEIKRDKKEDSIDEIFSSFSLRKENEDKYYSPVSQKRGSGRFVNALLFILSLLVVLSFSLYYLRYEITKNYPETKEIYEKIGIQATYFGQGLLFEDVTKLEYDDGYYPQMIITGFIVNKNSYAVEVPTISIKFLNDRNQVIEDIRYNANVESLNYNEMVQFDASLDKPSEKIDRIEVTFVK